MTCSTYADEEKYTQAFGGATCSKETFEDLQICGSILKLI
jgi:hypothetical protein